MGSSATETFRLQCCVYHSRLRKLTVSHHSGDMYCEFDRHRCGVADVDRFVPMVFIAQVLPVAIGGIGVREAALVLFLKSLG